MINKYFFQTGRTLIRMNEIKLEKMGISNPNHRLVFLIFQFYMLLVDFKANSVLYMRPSILMCL